MEMQELPLSKRQLNDLERIARENHMEPEKLVQLAVGALIAGANRSEGRIAELRKRVQQV